MAREGQATASSIQEGLEWFQPHMAIDGYPGTRWASEYFNMPQWLQIEWESPKKLWKVHISFEVAYAEAYQVQIWNGQDWVTKATVENNTLLIRDHVFESPVETTKLRLYFTKGNTAIKDSVSIWEVEAYSASLSTELYIPRTGSYVLSARIARGKTLSNMKVDFGNVSAIIPWKNQGDSFAWYEIGPIQLSAGKNPINLTWFGDVTLDAILLYSLHDEEETNLERLFEYRAPLGVANITLYKRVNPSFYNVKIETEEPFLLIFSDTYNPSWKVYIDDLEVPPVVVYSVVNGFFINKTGNFDITLYFTGQTYADLGLKISAATLVAVVAILATPSKVFKRLKKHIRRRPRAQKQN